MARVLLFSFLASLVLFTHCKKEKKEDTKLFPATMELSGTIAHPTAVGMVMAGNSFTGSIPFMVSLATLAPNPLGVPGEIQFVNVNPHDGSTRLFENSTAHTIAIKDPNYKTCMAHDANISRLVQVISEFNNDSTTSIIIKQFSIDGKTVFNTRTEKIINRIEITRVAVIVDGYILCGTIYNGNDRNVYVAKYSNSLSKRWEQIFGGAGNDGAMDAVQFCNNDIGVLAYTYSFGKGDRDYWFLKLSSATGQNLFSANFGTPGYEEPQRILKDKQCRYYLAGHTAGFGHPEHNAYIVCIDQDGSLLWENNYGTPLHDGFQAITLLPNNQGLLAAGRSMQTNAPHENLFIQAVDFNGKPLWSKTYGDPNLTEIPVDIITDNKFYYVLSNRIDAAGKFSVIFVKDELQ